MRPWPQDASVDDDHIPHHITWQGGDFDDGRAGVQAVETENASPAMGRDGGKVKANCSREPSEADSLSQNLSMQQYDPSMQGSINIAPAEAFHTPDDTPAASDSASFI